MADTLKTPGELANLGKASAKYFDKINRALMALQTQNDVPIGGGIVRATFNDGANQYFVGTAPSPLPSGYLKPNDQVLARTDYPDLFAALGVPTGTDSLNLPAATGQNANIIVRVL